MNLPNKLSLTRIILIPVFVALFYITAIPYNYCYSAIVFALAACTDFLDGYIARKYNLVTDLGKLLDAIADKVLVLTACVLIITQPEMINPIIGGIGVSIILARELIVSLFRMLAAAKNTVIAADKMGKIKTILQDICIVVFLCSYDFFGLFGGLYSPVNIVALVFFSLAVLMTIYSGIEMFIKNKHVLKSENKKED